LRLPVASTDDDSQPDAGADGQGEIPAKKRCRQRSKSGPEANAKSDSQAAVVSLCLLGHLLIVHWPPAELRGFIPSQSFRRLDQHPRADRHENFRLLAR